MKKLYRFTLLLLIVSSSKINFIWAQVTVITNTVTTTWTCPPGVATVTVQCWGGGGGGGYGRNVANAAGGGGGGGAYTIGTSAVVPLTVYALTVGVGGAGGTAAGAASVAGGITTCGTPAPVVANGGIQGVDMGAAGNGAGGAGGAAGTYAGGAGAAGQAALGGGGGGGSAGTAVGGITAITQTGAAAVAGGGGGGSGAFNATGTNGTMPGGGGGGGERNAANRGGGNGGAGLIIISYVTPPNITPFADLSFCTGAYPSLYQTVSFSLKERLATDFTRNQAARTIILTLPTGFEFNPAAAHTVTKNGGGSDITALALTSVTATAITITLSTSIANPNTNFDEIFFNNFEIRAIAAGSGDLLRTTTAPGTFLINSTTQQPLSTESFGFMFANTATVYNLSEVTQYTTASINRNCASSQNAVMLRVKINISGGCPPPTVTQFDFSTIGDAGFSQNPAANITSAKVYYNGLLQAAPLITQSTPVFGSVTAPVGTFTITGSQKLDVGSGDYYFFLVYDVPATATAGEGLDASMTSFVMDASTISDMTTPNPTGTRTIVSASCYTPDVPNPPANVEAIPMNSYVIPMDNTNQAVVAPFNMKAYGLVHSLLMNDIPVKWVILSGKVQDGIDFIANASRVLPTVVAGANTTFSAGAFIVDSTWINKSFYGTGKTATQVITDYYALGAGFNQVAIFKLTNDENLNVRYTLHARPKIAIFSNGGFQAVQTAYMTEAGITNYFVQNAGNFPGLAECYTFCSEAHWDFTTNPDINPVSNILKFVNEGGNFLAQCAGIDLYENHQPTGGHFQTTNGILFQNATVVNTYSNPDLAFNQFQGVVTSDGGTIGKYWLAPASTYKPETFYNVSAPLPTTSVVATSAHLAPSDSIGGNVYYLAGHDYIGATIGWINGRKMYLNATLVPSARPSAFTLDPGANVTICSGNSTTIGGSPTGGSALTNYIWSPATGLNNTTSANPVCSATVTTVYTVIANDNGCPGGPNTMTVTVDPTPAAPTPVGSNSPACEGSDLSLTASTIGGATYSWSGPNGFTSALKDPAIAAVTLAASGTYTVIASLGACPGPAATVSVTITPLPAAPTPGSNTPICAGQNLSLSSNTIAGATYNWTGPNSFTSASEDPTIAAATTAASGTYSVNVTVAGCAGPAGTTSVTVNPIPAAPVASADPNPVCEGYDLSLSASSTGTTYNWTGPNSFTSTSQYPVISPVVTADAGTYSVTATENGCTGPVGTVSVTVNPLPAAAGPITGTTPVCQGQSGASFSVSPIPNATSYVWVLPAGAAIVLGAGTNSIIVDFSPIAVSGNIQVYGTNACCAP